MSADSRAPIHRVPAGRIVTVEHPSIVRNFDKGLKSLGGEAQLKHVLEHHVGDSKLSSKQNQLPEPVVGVSLRPDDPFAKKIASVGVETRNVLVKVTVPKRTGRKRKRGSDEPFADSPQLQQSTGTAPDLLQRLRDNEGNYKTEVVGMLRETHRFRTLPDFQLRNDELPIMQNLKTHVLAPDYESFKNFRIDMSAGTHGITAFPGPPNFTSFDMPHKYEYQQAAGVVFVQDASGQVTAKNTSAPPKRLTWGLAPDVEEVPQAAPLKIPKRSPTGEMLPRAVIELEKLLEKRPLVTKRVALNSLPPISDTIFKEATQYVGYSFKAGPWRDLLIKYGVDPRKDPKYRFYQTLMFQVDREAFGDRLDKTTPRLKTTETNTQWARPLRHTRDAPETHIFDGKSITPNGKTWQVCDAIDPVVHKVFATNEIRQECDVYQWGWYYSGTMGKGRTIMKDKMRSLFAGEEPAHKDHEVLAGLPNIITPDNMKKAVLHPRTYGNHACALANEVRNIVKGGEGTRSHRQLWEQKRLASGEQAEDEAASVMDADEEAALRDLDVGDLDGDFSDDDEEEPDDQDGVQQTGNGYDAEQEDDEDEDDGDEEEDDDEDEEQVDIEEQPVDPRLDNPLVTYQGLDD